MFIGVASGTIKDQTGPISYADTTTCDKLVTDGSARWYRVATVQFAGQARQQVLTWGQERIANLMVMLHPWSDVNIVVDWPLPGRASEGDVLAALGRLVSRYEGLRTLFELDGEPWQQRPIGQGHLAVTVVEVTPDRVDEAAAVLTTAAAERLLDVGSELPLRATVLCVEGRVQRLLLCLAHLIIDDESLLVLRADLTAMLSGAQPQVPDAAVHQLVDQATAEQSQRGRRAGERALRHIEKVLRAVPLTMLPRPPREFDGRRFRYLDFRSRALWLAVDHLASRHGVGPTAVMHAGLCAVAGYVSSLDRALLQIIASTRSDNLSRGAVGPYSQSVPVWIDLTDASFPDLMQRSGAAVMAGLFHARHREADQQRLQRHVEAERGGALDLTCWINDRHADTSLGAGSAADISERTLHQATEQTRYAWVPGDEFSTSSYFLHVDSEGNQTLKLTFLVDTARLGQDEAIAWLTTLERMLCLAVHTDWGIPEIGRYTDLTPFPHPLGWSFVDHSWIDVPAVTDVVRELSGVADARVVSAPDETGAARLVAYLDGVSRLSVAELRAACFAEVYGRPTLIVPQEFVIPTQVDR